jgi:anti-sigma regulatory factor (Ser/Thr protein kinase)
VSLTASADGSHAADHANYRHEAFLYTSRSEFLHATLRFIREALAADEPVLVVLAAEKIAEIRSRLEAQSSAVLFVDMSELGNNPAHIIPAWDEFLRSHRAPGLRLRGIGEPIVPDQSPAKLAECQRHEALLNIAFANPLFWLLCPYDTSALGGAVIEQARRSHPVVNENGESGSSTPYAGAQALSEPCRDPLSTPPGDPTRLPFQEGDLPGVRSYVADHAARAGMRQDRIDDLVLATNEIATNSLRHGGTRGTLRAWEESGSVICEISDRGMIRDPLAGLLRPSLQRGGGRGLWLANQLCDLVQIRSLEPGNVVRLHVRSH